ncbi:DUF6153 family protein [Nocardia sp. NBC_00403]|uniref:DUF6153 family protein n=1 Tax=Nocardia sp. NBC_00403 TaxID=2975990 RepID=UPI002E1E21AD
MTAQHAPLRASGLPRLLGVLALLAGIIAMHAGVFAVPGEHHMAAAVTTAMPADDHGTAATGTDCGSDGCGDSHGGMHACVFILTAVGLILILVLLYRVTVDRPHLDAAALRNGRSRRERAPPWTVPSLAELSILRI